MKDRKDVQKTRKKLLPPTIVEAMDEYFADQRRQADDKLVSGGTEVLRLLGFGEYLACLDPAHRNHPKRLDFKVNL